MNNLKNAQIAIVRIGNSFKAFHSELRSVKLNPILSRELTDADSLICLEEFKLKYGGDQLRWISVQKERLLIVSTITFHLSRGHKQGVSLLESVEEINPGCSYFRGALRETINDLQNLNKRHLLDIVSILLEDRHYFDRSFD